MKTAYFAGGCFWCITPSFRALPGVAEVVSGYSGGAEVNPRYEDVKAQRTGHRETVAVRYDPERVTYASLLETFLSGVDPFDAGGQYIDRGASYTLAVFYGDESEHAAARTALSRLAAESGKEPCVTLAPFTAFYPAEAYHQNYDLRNPEAFERELIESGRKKA